MWTAINCNTLTNIVKHNLVHLNSDNTTSQEHKREH